MDLLRNLKFTTTCGVIKMSSDIVSIPPALHLSSLVAE